MTGRHGIAEWYGEPFGSLSVPRRQRMARAALKQTDPLPCPFQPGTPPCGKRGGVCSIGAPNRPPIITCPRRFDEGNLISRWLGRIVGFSNPYVAREVPFMRSTTTGRPAGRIDLVVSGDEAASSWYGLEIQAVYFSGPGMESEFRRLLASSAQIPPTPNAVRRPDWRSSSAKRLMPQLQVKAPTLRRWGSKLAVAVDLPFFESIGGPSDDSSHDLNDGDIVWLIPRITAGYRLESHHWEVLSLEDSCDKLLSAETVKRREFENALRGKLEPL
ncbi:MAG: hypothetical protein M2R45_02207 [Verrucomicrobia subdivision 3 bacterium]|nr:hypothetical protein [Limisphaerales bacterium]MCS1413782.1 hypothetical protein [Limisphaerales bacterium]